MALPSQRTATRMLPSSSVDAPGPASPRLAATTHPQQSPSAAVQPSPSSTGRRKSACFPLSASDAGPGDDTAGGGEGAAGYSGADSSPPHLLSVPLTLLSLHNGGHSRHMTRERSSRDTSPGPGLLARESSIGFGEVAPGADWSAGSPGASGGSAGPAGGGSPVVGSGGGGLLGGRRRTEMEGASPTPRLGAGISGLASPSVPAAGSPLRDSTSIWCTPAVSSAADIPAALSAPSGAAAAAIDASGLVPQSVVLAAAAASAAAAAAGGGGGSPAASGSGGGASPGTSGSGGAGGLHVTLPAHLCSLRPPTPLTKDEELMAAAAAAHSYASPSRRRSRFASSADPGLLLAAQAAVAADEAGLLESPPGSYSGTGGMWPDHSGAGRHGRRGPGAAVSTSNNAAAPGPVSLSFTAAPGTGAGGSSGGAGSSELPFARPLLGVALEPAPWSSPGRSTSRRAGPPALGTVPEESLIPHSRGDAFPSRPSALGASGSGPASPALNALGGSTHAGGAGGGLSPAAAAPGVSACSLTGRRQRLSTPQVPDLDQGGLNGPRSPSMTAGHGAAAAALGASGRRPGAGATTDDSLSSFMHSFGPNSSAAAAAARVASGVCSPAGGR